MSNTAVIDSQHYFELFEKLVLRMSLLLEDRMVGFEYSAKFTIVCKKKKKEKALLPFIIAIFIQFSIRLYSACMYFCNL